MLLSRDNHLPKEVLVECFSSTKLSSAYSEMQESEAGLKSLGRNWPTLLFVSVSLAMDNQGRLL